MLLFCLKKLLLVFCIGSLLACEAEKEFLDPGPPNFDGDPSLGSIAAKKQAVGLSSDQVYFENFQDRILHAVAPSECGATKFNDVLWDHFTSLFSDPVAGEKLQHYLYLNRQAAILGIGSDYFGEKGEYTGLVLKLKKDLERFYKLPREITVRGQHASTLNEREKIADIYWYSILDLESREEVYKMADEILYYNSLSPLLPESPLISSDGFSARHGLIVIGDGLIKLFTETGLKEDIVWTGILSHEWSHQIQFHHYDQWYKDYPFESEPEATRLLELEADFFSGYYMTHKRGATFNWKRAEQFFELFYQSGDCSFEFVQHHGTPLQRKKASFEGYLLAEAAKKKGHILSPEQLHKYFMEKVLPESLMDLQYL